MACRLKRRALSGGRTQCGVRLLCMSEVVAVVGVTLKLEPESGRRVVGQGPSAKCHGQDQGVQSQGACGPGPEPAR